MAGGKWPERARAAAIVLSRDDDVVTDSEQLLEDIRAVWYRDDLGDRVHSTQLCYLLASDTDMAWRYYNRGGTINVYQLARLLKPFGISPKTIRLDKYYYSGYGSTKKGYLLKWFEDAFVRYLPPFKMERPRINP